MKTEPYYGETRSKKRNDIALELLESELIDLCTFADFMIINDIVEEYKITESEAKDIISLARYILINE
jgi:hypothetical protein